jgi:hypothetical protein
LIPIESEFIGHQNHDTCNQTTARVLKRAAWGFINL